MLFESVMLDALTALTTKVIWIINGATHGTPAAHADFTWGQTTKEKTMKQKSHVIMGILIGMFVLMAATRSMAQDPISVAPDKYKVLLDNDRVRVLEASAKPGDKVPKHHHGPTVQYSFVASKAKFTPGTVRSFRGGQVDWSAGGTHTSEVVGSNASHALIVELKKGGKAGKTVRGADPVRVDPKHFKVRLSNAWVRVLEFTAKPGDKVPMHAHPDYVTYNFTGGKTKFTSADGKTEEREAAAGTATWRDSENHGAEILSGEGHALLIELKAPRGK